MDKEKNKKAIELIDSWINAPVTQEDILRDTIALMILQEKIPCKFEKILKDNFWDLLI